MYRGPESAKLKAEMCYVICSYSFIFKLVYIHSSPTSFIHSFPLRHIKYHPISQGRRPTIKPASTQIESLCSVPFAFVTYLHPQLISSVNLASIDQSYHLRHVKFIDLNLHRRHSRKFVLSVQIFNRCPFSALRRPFGAH